ncbi:MAG: methyltransferase domain-containing protein [Desulfomonile tiedjei]|uniref:Methyltransferase domain-containing protein n=1 Tax=Desulfomonile tiedjei TaxID=2358 RepID=A0A9D6V267_9BACT|nr:methyltransferase domain-containing protein [Desulfomonile tiedjei]
MDARGTLQVFRPVDFAREDDSSDEAFYRRPRFVNHLDSLATATVEDVYSRLILRSSRVLDLMAGPDSHLRPELEPRTVSGLGLNEEELGANPILSEWVIHDLNACPALPFEDNRFDVVINTVSVDYLTRPIEVFRDVNRILGSGGLFIVVFSNRMFPTKAVNIWRITRESKRPDLVRKFFSEAGRFSIEGFFESKNKPRPTDDKYYSLGIPSDPVYALWGKVTK